MGETIAEYLIKQGEERGERRGERRGEERGALRAKREAVLRLLQLRFDAVPPTLLRKVRSMRRTDRLDALFEKAAIAKSVDEIEMG